MTPSRKTKISQALAAVLDDEMAAPGNDAHGSVRGPSLWWFMKNLDVSFS